MLEYFNKSKVKHFDTLTDEELLREKELAEKQWNYIQTVKSLPPVTATVMMGKMEWYIGKVLAELFARQIDGGFKYTKPPAPHKKLQLIKKHDKKNVKRVKFGNYILPSI